jgi:hypothetical protein
MTADFRGRATVAKLRIRLEIIFNRGTSGLRYGIHENFDFFVGTRGPLTYPVLCSFVSFAYAYDVASVHCHP